MKNINNHKIFSLFGLFWVCLGWLAMLLTFLDFFYAPILAIFTILSLASLIYIAIINRNNFSIKKDFIIIAILSLIAVAIFSYFTSPTIFSGRDQGSLSSAAIILSQNHQLEYSFPAEKEFFQIYGAGTALNFPGFNYNTAGNLVPHFPLGYISWLAIFYSFFGIFGLILANAITFFLFLISFYSVSKNYLRSSATIAAFLLIITSFVFSWFFKFTLSENLALGLVWFGLSQFLLFLKNENRLAFFSFLASFGLLIFVRIEALAFLAIIPIVLFVKYKNKKIFFKNILGKSGVIILSFIILIFLISLKVNGEFYLNFIKGFVHSFEVSQKSSALSPQFIQETFYVFKVFAAYALLSYFLLGLAAFFYFLKKKAFSLLLPFFILLPSFIYIVNPSITLDHPWMLRRYLFSIIPLSILYTIIFLDYFFKKTKYFYAFCFFLLLTNLIMLIPYLGVSENKNLLNETEKLSHQFGSDDLVLVDRLASGDPWSMLAGPLNLLYGKQAVYFFNPQDLQKINLKNFNNVYFIIPYINIDFYKTSNFFPNLIPIKDYALEKQILSVDEQSKSERLANPIRLPIYEKKFVYGKIYLLKK